MPTTSATWHTPGSSRPGHPGTEASGEDAPSKRALFEDLGDLSLYTALKFQRDPAKVEDLYRRVLDILVTLHGPATEQVGACRP